MEQLEIIQLIEKRKREIEEELQEESMEVKFCEEYTDNYRGSNLDSIAIMDLCDLFITIYRSNSKKISFEDLHDFVSKNTNFIRFVHNEKTIISLFSELENLMESGNYDTIQNYFKEGNKVSSISQMLTSDYFMYKLFEENIQQIIGYKEGYDIYTIMEMYKQDGLEIFKTKAAISIIYEFQGLLEQNDYARSMAEQTANQKLDKKRANKIRERFLSGYNIEGIQEYIYNATKYAEGVLSKDKKRKTKLTKKLNALDKLEKDLFTMISKGEITRADKLIEKIEDEDIRTDVLKLIYNHNLVIYKALEEEHEKLTSKSTAGYKMLLANYGITPEHYEISDITTKSLEEISQMLEIAKTHGITGPKIMVEILKNGNLETITYLENLMDKNIISKEFLIKNKNVFSSDSEELSNLIQNINFFNEKGLNIHYLRASQEILVIDSKKLEENISVLEEYDLINMLKTGESVSFLQQDNLETSIDTLLELGYEQNLEESLEILNYSENFQRLRIIKELNVPITTTEELIDVLSSDKFIIPTDEISSYIYNAVEYLIPKVEEKSSELDLSENLAKYSNTKRTYNFNGILISKNKVNKNLSNVSDETDEKDKLVYSVVKGSVLSDEEFETIDNIIRGITPKTMKKTQSNE